MNNFTLSLWDDEASKCTFYTVKQEDSQESETDKFFRKYDAIPGLKLSAQILLSYVLDSIGEDHGAIDQLFNRFENGVVGLPNKERVNVGEIAFLFPDFPLRLYALRINNRSDLVVLFNGGVKSSATNQGSKYLNLRWLEACRFARRIEEALWDGEIIIDETNRRLLYYDGDEDILL